MDDSELSFNNCRILSTNGYKLCPTPVGSVNLSIVLPYDEHLWRSDERFCLRRLLRSLTKGYAEWPIVVQSVLLIRQQVMNTADGLYWMTIAECAVQLVIDNWPSSNAKRCSTSKMPYSAMNERARKGKEDLHVRICKCIPPFAFCKVTRNWSTHRRPNFSTIHSSDSAILEILKKSVHVLTCRCTPLDNISKTHY